MAPGNGVTRSISPSSKSGLSVALGLNVASATRIGGRASRPPAGRPADVPKFGVFAPTPGAFLASVCTGTFILAAAGLLNGKPAATPWSTWDELRQYPNVFVVPQRFVDEGGIVTAAGISAGIDMPLDLVARLPGNIASHQVARTMGYPASTLWS